VVHVLKLISIPHGPKHDHAFVKIVESPAHSIVAHAEEGQTKKDGERGDKLLHDLVVDNLDCCWQNVELVVELQVHDETQPDLEGGNTEHQVLDLSILKRVEHGEQVQNRTDGVQAVS